MLTVEHTRYECCYFVERPLLEDRLDSLACPLGVGGPYAETAFLRLSSQDSVKIVGLGAFVAAAVSVLLAFKGLWS